MSKVALCKFHATALMRKVDTEWTSKRKTGRSFLDPNLKYVEGDASQDALVGDEVAGLEHVHAPRVDGAEDLSDQETEF